MFSSAVLTVMVLFHYRLVFSCPLDKDSPLSLDCLTQAVPAAQLCAAWQGAVTAPLHA